MEALFFYVFALAAVASSALVVTVRKPTYAVLALAGAIFSQAGLFVMLGAYFVAMIQILIYAGAILVLFLFVIMLLGISSPDSPPETPNLKGWLNILLIAAFLAELLVVTAGLQGRAFGPLDFPGTVEAIGAALFTRYLLPFELVSGILLIGIFGVVGLRERKTR